MYNYGTGSPAIAIASAGGSPFGGGIGGSNQFALGQELQGIGRQLDGGQGLNGTNGCNPAGGQFGGGFHHHHHRHHHGQWGSQMGNQFGNAIGGNATAVASAGGATAMASAI